MNAPLLYRPSPPWPICTAFAGAVLLHVAAIAIAAHQPPPLATVSPRSDDVILTFEETESQGPLPPAPEVEEPPPPPVPAQPPDFIDTPPLPPRVRSPSSPAPPVARPRQSTAAPPRSGSPKVLALSASRPEYPYEARRQRTTGSGMALLLVDPGSGRVTDVQMLRSTGSTVLDQAALTGFRRWRFPAGTAARVQVPITYTLSGASY